MGISGFNIAIIFWIIMGAMGVIAFDIIPNNWDLIAYIAFVFSFLQAGIEIEKSFNEKEKQDN